MKLVRYGAPGEEQPGILDPGGNIRSLVGIVPDICGPELSAATLDRIRQLDISSLPLIENGVRFGPCIGSVSKIVGVAQNYHCFVSHADLPYPKHPVLFIKPPSSISGPTDDILLEHDSDKADWEIELGVVIGRTARSVSTSLAMEHVAGFCILNDITERGRVARTGQFVDGKSADTFAPIGPYLVTTDEVEDHTNLGIYFDLNGDRYQNGNTSSMIFGVDYLISHISKLMTLVPGDVIATGTPKGVGARSVPPRFLRAGDEIRASIDHLGLQRAKVIARS
jgi:2,4-didehydro-3-deoxy-L-rhamnonate hydrolase